MVYPSILIDSNWNINLDWLFEWAGIRIKNKCNESVNKRKFWIWKGVNRNYHVTVILSDCVTTSAYAL